MLRLPLFLLPVLMTVLSGCMNAVGPGHSRQRVLVKSGYTLTRNIIYTPADWPVPVKGDLYRPRTAGPAPAVLLVHGGGWTGKDGRWQMHPIAEKLAKRGYIVMNVTYRLAPRWIYPAPVDDVGQALAWMRENAAAHGIDTRRISLFGYSAGGYVAAHVAFRDRSEEKIVALVAGGTPSDLRFYPAGKLVPQFLGGTINEVPERFKEASPVTYVTANSPPVFIYHAERDELVRPEHAWAMIHALEDHGVPHEVYWVRELGHIAAFLLPGGSVEAAVDFLDRKTKMVPPSR